MQVEIDGNALENEHQMHLILERAFDYGPHYGRNLAALWDFLGSGDPRPVKLVWRSASESRKRLGSARFDEICSLLRDIERKDIERGWRERFVFVCEGDDSG